MSEPPTDRPWTAHRERTDALRWVVLAVAGLALAALAVQLDARLGTASAPFLGRYKIRIGVGSILAPAVAAGTLWLASRGRLARLDWPGIQLFGYAAGLIWAISLALVDGWSGLTKALGSPEEYLGDVRQVGDDPVGYLRHFTSDAAYHSVASRGHPPGPVLFLWGLDRIGVDNHIVLGFLITAVSALTIPLVLSAVRDSVGEEAARRYLPVLVLAPYAIWVAVSLDGLVAVLGAAAIVAGLRASRRRVRGWPASGWALLAGLLIGLAALFSYSAPWLGLSLVCVYFARRRAFLNVMSGVGALLPVLGAQLLGFAWADGLVAAETDYASRVAPYRSVLWWSAISVVVLLLATGPAIAASARKIRNTAAWPFLVGAGAAVVFSIAAGLARGGVEHAWLPFFPWLTVAAIAPERPAGELPPTPLLLVTMGAVLAVVIEAVLVTPW
ncbi:membrane protein [Dactylosporangium sucinum]|uniref:Membrane protein n=1 Tax=Dactylosporangium sucinum TaxID=1424081 RepID=A0A917T6K6_9ACTN|nr:membrane protein [Dactylosporangium sucinum]